ncbi:hypothetical protein BKA70DRAFT_1422935 [Coprinopsis sp. MPI-PUGE-AT-0042]|nr:hypothetical protein BKA70DRAFT_1422935 [Coprinopsis sp. MPI-PUGE-AT-0042]
MVLHISIISVSVTSLAIESLLYGFFLLLSSTSCYLLLAKERHSDRPKNRLAALTTPLILANLLLPLTITTHWVLSIVRAVDAFVKADAGSSSRLYYEDLTSTLFVVKVGFVILTLIVGDCVMLYRMRTVFKYNRSTVVFPLCCTCGFIACGVGTVFQFSKVSTNKNVFLASIGIVFTFITNVYCSAFIAWKIYRVNAATTSLIGKGLGGITTIIVESAAIYTAWTVMFMGAYLSSSNLVYIFADTIPVITGISFMLINVRIGLGWALNVSGSSSNTAAQNTNNSLSFRPITGQSRLSGFTGLHGFSSHGPRGMGVSTMDDGLGIGLNTISERIGLDTINVPATVLEPVSEGGGAKHEGALGTGVGRSRSKMGVLNQKGDYQMTALAVHIEREVVQDDDDDARSLSQKRADEFHSISSDDGRDEKKSAAF